MNWTETRARLIERGIYKSKLPETWQQHINLRWANLSGAVLSEADLSGADLRLANLRGANLSGADLSEANLTDVFSDYLTVGIYDAPEGELVVWGRKSGHIVKMLVPADCPRSCATTRKHRSAYVRVLKIDDGAVESFVHASDFGNVTYTVGEETHADSWDEDRWNECSHGIHWFLTRAEA